MNPKVYIIALHGDESDVEDFSVLQQTNEAGLVRI